MKSIHGKDWPCVADGWQYARDVVAGKVITGNLVKQACAKSLKELDDDEYYWGFDIEAAQNVLDFCFFVPHVQGALAGRPTRPNPWQVWVICQMFGWSREGTRRFRQVVLEVARKNGKSFICSLFAIHELLKGDHGAEVYSVATKRDQAKKVWQDAVQMTKMMDPRVGDKFKSTVTNLFVQESYSKYTAVGRDSDTLDGLNPSLTIIDEAAAIQDRNMIEVFESATGGRDNPMIVYITTAQPGGKSTAYYEKRQYAQNILDGTIDIKPPDDTLFAAIYSLDDGDDFRDVSTWCKANPNLEYLPTIGDTIRSALLEVDTTPSKLNNVLIKHFNIYTSTSSAWLDVTKWDKSTVPTLRCDGDMFIGMDLAQISDLCSVARLWVAGDRYHVDFKCFIPRHVMADLPVHTKSIYTQAIAAGSLILTEGETTDQHQIQYYIEQSAEKYNLKGIAYDPYNANMLVSALEDQNLPMYIVRQGMSDMSAASKETERLILEGLIEHQYDPFTSWQLSNCEVYRDLNENIKVRKGDDRAMKIDSVIALITAVSLAAGSIEQVVEPDIWLM